MSASKAGDVLCYRDQGCDVARVVVRNEGSSLLVVDAGWDGGGPLVERLVPGGTPGTPFRREAVDGLHLSRPAKPRSIDVDAAALALLAAADPAEAAALGRAGWREAYFYGSYASRDSRIAQTPNAFRLRSPYDEFDSGDMVRMLHDRRCYVLCRPLLAIGVYIGDRGRQLQVCGEGALPTAALDVFLAAAGA